MDTFGLLAHGLAGALQPLNLLYALIGVTLGTAVGVLPGPLEPAPPHPQLPATVKEAEAIGVRQNPTIVAARFAERGAVSDFDRARAASGLTIQATGAPS